MKKFIAQLSIILVISICTALLFNYLSKNPMPLFKVYEPHQAVIDEAVDIGKDQPVTFGEVDADILSSYLESGAAVVFDARSEIEYNQGFIPGAHSFPISQFKQKYPELLPFLEEGKMIIVYCTGNDCTDSTMLAMELYKKGFKDLFIYKGGMEEWMQLGNPVDIPEETISGGSGQSNASSRSN